MGQAPLDTNIYGQPAQGPMPAQGHAAAAAAAQEAARMHGYAQQDGRPADPYVQQFMGAANQMQRPVDDIKLQMLIKALRGQ